MEGLLQGLPHVVFHLDYVLTGVNDEEHLSVLEQVLNQMKQSGLCLNKIKCEFMSSSAMYLSQCIGLHPISDQVNTIQ